MLKSFFKIALRYLWRKKTYSALNYMCLTFGLTCAIITILYILNVFSFDKFHKNYNRLYLVDAYVTYFNGARFPKDYLSASLTDVLKEHAPEIEEMTRVAERDYPLISGDKTFTEKGLYADSNFFNVFTFPLVKAGSLNVMTYLNSIVISEHMATKFFENTDCVGKTIILKDGSKHEAYKVAGVFQEVPFSTNLFRDLIPYADLSLPSNLVGLAFIVALLLACMGLFGLASFTSENRTKEIGLRKANGATTLSVMRLLLTRYTKWLTIAFLMALPIASLLGKNFLGRFYFHSPMPLWAFLAGPVIAFVVALLTVSSQTWRVANRNPVKALRYE